MLKDFGCPRIVKLKDSGGTIINPATNEKLDELKSLLQQIENAVDDLEVKAENINLNTDTLEAKIQSVRDQLDALLSTRASEVTLQAILDALGQESGTDILSELKSIVATLDVDLSTLATESTLIQVRNYLDTVETKLQSLITNFDVALSTRASETTVSSILSQLDITLSGLRDALKGTGGKDFTTLEADVESILTQLDVALSTRASESTLVQVRDYLDTVETKLQSIITALTNDLNVRLKDKDGNGITSEGFSGGKQALDVNVIGGNISIDEVGIKDSSDTRIDPATEGTLQQIEGHLDTVESKLQTIINRLDVDLSTRASETTLQEVRDTIGQESGVTVLSRLKDLWDKLVELFVSPGTAKVKIHDGTNTAGVTTENRLKVDVQDDLDVNITSLHYPGMWISKHLLLDGSEPYTLVKGGMNVDGSSTPKNFYRTPPSGKKWYITRIKLTMEESSSISHKKFGNQAALTNGLQFKVTENGSERDFYEHTFKTNGSFQHLATSTYLEAANTDLFSVNFNILKTSGTVLELKNSTSDNFKIVVQDDLTGINFIECVIFGYEVDE